MLPTHAFGFWNSMLQDYLFRKWLFLRGWVWFTINISLTYLCMSRVIIFFLNIQFNRTDFLLLDMQFHLMQYFIMLLLNFIALCLTLHDSVKFLLLYFIVLSLIQITLPNIPHLFLIRKLFAVWFLQIRNVSSHWWQAWWSW